MSSTPEQLPDNPMSDAFTKEKRSAVMSRIRGKRNRDTELLFAKLLRKQERPPGDKQVAQAARIWSRAKELGFSP